MNFESMLPLIMMMSGSGGASGANYEEMMRTLSSGGTPGDSTAPGTLNPQALNMMKLMSAANSNGGKGLPPELLIEMLGGQNAEIKKMAAMMEMMKNFNNQPEPQSVTAESTAPAQINELKPIKHIAPDRIHNSMEEYLKKYKGQR